MDPSHGFGTICANCRGFATLGGIICSQFHASAFIIAQRGPKAQITMVAGGAIGRAELTSARMTSFSEFSFLLNIREKTCFLPGCVRSWKHTRSATTHLLFIIIFIQILAGSSSWPRSRSSCGSEGGKKAHVVR